MLQHAPVTTRPGLPYLQAWKMPLVSGCLSGGDFSKFSTRPGLTDRDAPLRYVFQAELRISGRKFSAPLH